MDSPKFLDPHQPVFPDPSQAANDELGGLLAIGGNLAPATLLAAYRSGIFPWFEDSQPILWWSPPQRAVIFPNSLHVSRSLQKIINRGEFEISSDRCFREVINGCAAPRSYARSTWITAEMRAAYCHLHELGHVHSIEVWRGSQLAGGLYGVAVGSLFCGESMFSRQSNASKIALVVLARTLFSCGFEFIDCQLENPHLQSMGAVIISRQQFLQRLTAGRDKYREWPSQWKLTRL